MVDVAVKTLALDLCQQIRTENGFKWRSITRSSTASECFLLTALNFGYFSHRSPKVKGDAMPSHGFSWTRWRSKSKSQRLTFFASIRLSWSFTAERSDPSDIRQSFPFSRLSFQGPPNGDKAHRGGPTFRGRRLGKDSGTRGCYESDEAVFHLRCAGEAFCLV